MYRVFYICLLFMLSCSEYTPKPRGYVRLEPAAALYVQLPVTDLPYSFSISDKVTIELPDEQPVGWITFTYPELNATLYGSFFLVTNDKLSELTGEAHKLVERMGQPSKVSAYENPESKVYGKFFEISGNVASPLQFFLTDSLSRFFRGALYYHKVPESDSIAPVTDYLRKDMIELVQTFSWKD